MDKNQHIQEQLIDIPLYKYQNIPNDISKLDGNYTYNNLINHISRFSKRSAFNDPFDSYVDILNPTPNELYKTLTDINTNVSISFRDTHIQNGAFTIHGYEYMDRLRNNITNTLDRIGIYCLTSKSTNMVMWSHYANEHKGICIEYKPNTITAWKVQYSDVYPTLNLMDWVGNNITNNDIITAINTKLNDWSYEYEYRRILTNNKGLDLVNENDSGKNFQYYTGQIQSIIFGVKTPFNIKHKIINELPYNTEFKQVIMENNRLKIIPYIK